MPVSSTQKLNRLITIAKNNFPKYRDLPDANFMLLKRNYGSIAKDNFLKVLNKDGRPSWIKFVFLNNKGRGDSLQEGINDLTSNYLLSNIFKRNKSTDFEINYDYNQNLLISTSSLVEGKNGKLDYIDQKTQGGYKVPQHQLEEDDNTPLQEFSNDYIHTDIDSLLRQSILNGYISNIQDDRNDNQTGYNQNGAYKTYQFDGRGGILQDKDIKEWKIPKHSKLSKVKYLFKKEEFIDTNNSVLDKFINYSYFSVPGYVEQFTPSNLHKYMESHGIANNSDLRLGVGSDSRNTQAQSSVSSSGGASASGNTETQFAENRKMIILIALQKLVALRGEYLQSIENFRRQPKFNETATYLHRLAELYTPEGLSKNSQYPLHDMNLMLNKIEERYIAFTNLIEYYTDNWNKSHDDKNRIPSYFEQTQAKHEYRRKKGNNSTTNRTIDIVVKEGESASDIATNIFKSMQSISEEENTDL